MNFRKVYYYRLVNSKSSSTKTLNALPKVLKRLFNEVKHVICSLIKDILVYMGISLLFG